MRNKTVKKKKKYLPPKIDSKPIYEVNALGCNKCPNAALISLSISCIRGTVKYS